MNSLPFGFVAVPIYSWYKDNDFHDDLGYNGCGYIKAGDGTCFGSDDTYNDYNYLVEALTDPMCDCLGLSDEVRTTMTFRSLYDYCDVI